MLHIWGGFVLSSHDTMERGRGWSGVEDEVRVDGGVELGDGVGAEDGVG